MKHNGRSAASKPAYGFSLIELMVVLVIVAIIAGIAYPSYTDYITRTRRAAAEACLSSYADFMERFYATNMNYAKDGSGTALSLPALDCASAQNTGVYYGYGFAKDSPTTTTYTLQAVPKGIQKTRDTKCGTLSIDQTGQRGETGAGTLAQCWGQ